MKKLFIALLLSLVFIPKTFAYTDGSLIMNARNGILIEVSTGEILYEKNKDERVAVASLTKMMVQILVLEKIEDGSIKWNDVVTASKNASGMGGTQIWLATGEKMSVRDLFKGMSIVSANDATVALAEYVAGSEEKFVELMNKKAKELGLKNTVYKNVTGLDEDGHVSSAYDLSVIARELMKHEQIFEFTSSYEDYIRENTPNKYWLVNTNKLVRFYEGTDGLKTGFTDNAGYSMAVTTKRDGMRLLAIVLGEKEGKVRNSETMELLDFGFQNYKVDTLKKKGEVVTYLDLDKANKKVPVVLKNDLTILSKKTDKSLLYDFKINMNDNSLPIKSNSVVGKINLVNDNKIVKSEDLIITEDIYKVGYFKYLLDMLYSIF